MALLNKGDTNPIFLDTGFYRNYTLFRDDLVEGALARLFHAHLMDGIGASLESNHEGTLHHKVIHNEGKVSVLEVTGIFMPELKGILLIPHDNFMELQRLNNPETSFNVTCKKYFLNLYDKLPITIHY